MEDGKVLEVSIVPTGTNLVADAAIGATTFVVDDAGDFDWENGGQLTQVVPGGTNVVYTYTSITHDDITGNDTFSVNPAVSVAAFIGDRLLMYPASDDKWSLINSPEFGEDAQRVRIPREKAGYFPDGVRNVQDQESVWIELDEKTDEWVVVDLIGNPAQLEGSAVKLATEDLPALPPTTDQLAPTSCPAPTITGGVGSLAVSWPAPVNPDPVTIDVFVGTSAGVSTAGTPLATVRSNGPGVIFFRTVGGVPVAVGQNYYAKLKIRDDDGPGPDSVEAGPVQPAQINSPDIAANAITTALLLANNILADAINATDLTGTTITGALVQTDPTPLRGVKMGAVSGMNGIVAYGPTGDIFLSVDPATGIAIVAGEVKATTLTVTSGSSLGGVTEIPAGSKMVFNSGTTAPKSAPTVSSAYDTVQFTTDAFWANRKGAATDGTYLYTLKFLGGFNSTVLEKWNMSTGALAGSVAITPNTFMNDGAAGTAFDGTFVYCMWKVSGAWSISRYTTALVVDSPNPSRSWNENSGTRQPAIGWDTASNELLIAQSRSTNADKVRIHRYPWGAPTDLILASSIDSTFAHAFDLSKVMYGTFDLGATNRYIFANTVSDSFKVMNATTGAEVTAESWASGMSKKVGFVWDATASAFKSLDQNGVLRIYTGSDKLVAFGSSTLIKWISNTLAQGATPTYETDQSPRQNFVMPKRTKMIVTTSAIPGTDPDRVRIYVGSGATDPGRTAMWLQSSPAAGDITEEYTSLATSGTNPPSANTFPAGAAANFESTATDSGGTIWRGYADGPGRMGPWKWDSAGKDLTPRLRAHRDTDTTAVASSSTLDTKLFFPTVDYNVGGFTVGETNSSFTIPETAIYDIEVHVPWSGSTSGRRGAVLTVGAATSPTGGDSTVIGGSNIPANSIGGAPNHISVRGRLLTSGDILRVWITQNSGAGLVVANVNYGIPEISIVKVAPAP